MAFSFIFSTGILIGVLGGLAGGRLPGLLARLHLAASGLSNPIADALLTGLHLVLARSLAAIASQDRRLRLKANARFYRPSPLVTRFLIAIAAWNLGTGRVQSIPECVFSPATDARGADRIARSRPHMSRRLALS